MDDSFERRIINNLRCEAEMFVKKGWPLPERTQKYAEIRQKFVDDFLLLYGSIADQKERHKIEKIEKRLNTAYGDEWIEWAKTLYKLDGNSVSSSARDWKEAKEWHFSKRSDALLQVEKLIKYKMQDRARGRGSIDKDLGLEEETNT